MLTALLKALYETAKLTNITIITISQGHQSEQIT